MIFKYPYTDMYALNLDWIIQAIKEMQETIGPLDHVVNTVNGMTGDVEITKALLTQILGNLVETFNGRTGDVELTAEDVNNTLIDITWTSDPGDTIGDLSQSELDEMYLSGKRVLIFVNNLSVADQIYFLQYYEGHAQPQEYSPTSALAGVASFNGQTGNVTATGANLQTSTTDTHTIAESLAYLDEIKVPTVRTVNSKALNANIVLSDEDIPSQVVQGQTTVEGVLTDLDQRVSSQSAEIASIRETNTAFTALTISNLETALNTLLATMTDHEIRAIRIASGITTNGFKSGVTYSGYITRLSSGLGSCSLVDHVANNMFIGISGGTYYYNSVTTNTTSYNQSIGVGANVSVAGSLAASYWGFGKVHGLYCTFSTNDAIPAQQTLLTPGTAAQMPDGIMALRLIGSDNVTYPFGWSTEKGLYSDYPIPANVEFRIDITWYK